MFVIYRVHRVLYAQAHADLLEKRGKTKETRENKNLKIHHMSSCGVTHVKTNMNNIKKLFF